MKSNYYLLIKMIQKKKNSIINKLNISLMKLKNIKSLLNKFNQKILISYIKTMILKIN